MRTVQRDLSYVGLLIGCRHSELGRIVLELLSNSRTSVRTITLKVSICQKELESSSV